MSVWGDRLNISFRFPTAELVTVAGARRGDARVDGASPGNNSVSQKDAGQGPISPLF